MWPRLISPPPKHKPNLVLIYVESLESGFGDPALMGEDLLAPLNAATQDAYRFNDYEQTTGTGWTIAGIVSTQCGIPLKSHALFDGNQQGEKVKSFLPGARCLGEVLADNGYKNVFLGGASLYFAGKGKFFAQHGYSELYGKEEWSRAGHKQFNDWGLYDDALFKEAKVKVDALQKSRQPFNLTLLTVDTHPSFGYISPTCAKQGVTDYKGIVHCTAGLVADFVGHLKQRGYLKNTVVVILGDHLSGQTPVEAILAESPKRTIYNRFLTPNKLDQNRDRTFHFGIFPSILYAMGFRFPDNRLGIGASGFGPADPNFTLPNLDAKSFSELTAKTSRKYMEFWEPNEGAYAQGH